MKTYLLVFAIALAWIRPDRVRSAPAEPRKKPSVQELTAEAKKQKRQRLAKALEKFAGGGRPRADTSPIAYPRPRVQIEPSLFAVELRPSHRTGSAEVRVLETGGAVVATVPFPKIPPDGVLTNAAMSRALESVRGAVATISIKLTPGGEHDVRVRVLSAKESEELKTELAAAEAEATEPALRHLVRASVFTDNHLLREARDELGAAARLAALTYPEFVKWATDFAEEHQLLPPLTSTP